MSKHSGILRAIRRRLSLLERRLAECERGLLTGDSDDTREEMKGLLAEYQEEADAEVKHLVWCFVLSSRYVFILVAGVILSFASMGSYSLLVLTPAFLSAFLLPAANPASVHRWAFLLQMSWQTLCHLWFQYASPRLEDTQNTRFSISISSLMLLTQRVTSLALDIHEGKLRSTPENQEHGSFQRSPRSHLALCSYMLFFPALLGGPLCSFLIFDKQIKGLGPSLVNPIWIFGCMCLRVLVLQTLRIFMQDWVINQPGLAECSKCSCVSTMWTTALLFKMTYYSHWLLDESLVYVAGFGLQLGHQTENCHRELSDMDLWTLETTNRLSLFTRTWNKSTSQWLRRLIFQKSPMQPLLVTFIFSAWWHGLYPGQVFGFLCWAVMVEADYRINQYFSLVVKSWHAQLLYRFLTLMQTQLVIAYIMIAVEMRSFSVLWMLCGSYCSIFPLLNCGLLIWLVKRSMKT
ncbi:membrane-bound ghrelin O-acyltransferase MBOAT4 [Lissotriton helveticus]